MVRKLGHGNYEVNVDGIMLGIVRKRCSGRGWAARRWVDGHPRPFDLVESVRTRREAVQWLVDGPQWAVRMPGCAAWSEHLTREDAEAELAGALYLGLGGLTSAAIVARIE